MPRIRVYELAKSLGVPSREILSFLANAGYYVSSASSPIAPDLARRAKEHFSLPGTQQASVGNAAIRRFDPCPPDLDLESEVKSVFGEVQGLKFRHKGADPLKRVQAKQRQSIRGREQLAWAKHLFPPEEAANWNRDDIRDADLAAAYRTMGLRPGDLSNVILGRTGREWIASGVTAKRLANLITLYQSRGEKDQSDARPTRADD